METTLTPLPKVFKITRDQKPFLNSQALIKGFVGGIGSGKSYAGAYDMIRRIKPGRLYMVIAPTYVLLSDASFRSFVEVAQKLDLVLPENIKKGAPPSIKLCGAEVLFRSADRPEHLRGPNLSGIWLDEASLMDESVYTICIGRLRQEGEQGWLTATFTPKGKRNWTYDVFATKREGTEIFHARTADNPFLPNQFYDTLKSQYTSQFSQQELEGLFVDPEGTMFRRSWFEIIEVLPQTKARVRAWDLAATKKKEKKEKEGSHDPDWTAGCLMTRTINDVYVIADSRRLRGTPQEVESFILNTATEDGRPTQIEMEQEPGSSGIFVIDYYMRKLAGYSFHGKPSTGDKATRAMPLASQAENGNVKLLRGHWNKPFLDEIEEFFGGKHDDQVDAASLAFSKITERKQFWIA